VTKAAEKGTLRVENVELKARLRPSARRRLVRWGAFLILVFISLWLGRWIGSEAKTPRAPIPVPLNQDTTIPKPGAR
jgi:hypothetical protein